MNRRMVVLSLGFAMAAPRNSFADIPTQPLTPVRIVLSTTCGCCKEWVAHLQQHGFETEVEEVSDINRRKTAARIPEEYWSCHTAFVGGYFIEGHVPASDIKRLLNESPNARGLAVPDMPVGSPGMEMPNVSADSYKTLLVGFDNRATTWAEH